MQHGSRLDPANRFLSTEQVPDFDHWDEVSEPHPTWSDRKIEYLADTSRSFVTSNDSPDIPFRYSANPYRGCAHGCAYCYARNTHEYLGLNAGLDFETKIFVKQQAPQLFREFLARDAWCCEPIIFCGVTDCYQPAEREYRLMRQCLEVALECRQPVSLITKNALIVRDVDLLAELAKLQLVHAHISINSLDPELARVMEPRTSIPAARLRAVKALSDAGVPVRVMVAPIIPGLNDHEAPAVMKAVREAGALDARYVMLRLPLTVEPVFREWLTRTQGAKAEKVEGLIRHMRHGEMSSANWGERMRGTGPIAEQFATMFAVFRQKLGFGDLLRLDTSQFRSAVQSHGQLRLF
ncbi:PA0069 family radical SAM protein [bacterium]|nr:PA0069 family radical SAM protein [bacterium]